MKKLSKFFNNPFLLLISFALVWGLTGDFFYLTYAIMALVTIQVVLEKLAHSEVSKPLFISWCLLMPLGLITVALRDPVFLQWKFSIVHWLFGLILLISNFYKGPVLLKMLLSQLGSQSESSFSKAKSNVTNFAGLFLIVVGFVNLYFIYFMPLEAWVQFKIWGVTLLNFVMISAAIAYLMRKGELDTSKS